jgi:hypothetical protein
VQLTTFEARFRLTPASASVCWEMAVGNADCRHDSAAVGGGSNACSALLIFGQGKSRGGCCDYR